MSLYWSSAQRKLTICNNSGNVLWPCSMKLPLSRGITFVNLRPEKLIWENLKIVNSWPFYCRTKHTFRCCLEECQRNKEIESFALYYRKLISYIWHQMAQYTCNLIYTSYLKTESQYTSNLIYIASCLFIPSQYDVYCPLSNTALSGATSECPFHNRNISTH